MRWCGRERERIKRKARRWRERLRGMDTLERRAILWGLREAGVIEDRQIYGCWPYKDPQKLGVNKRVFR